MQLRIGDPPEHESSRQVGLPPGSNHQINRGKWMGPQGGFEACGVTLAAADRVEDLFLPVIGHQHRKVMGPRSCGGVGMVNRWAKGWAQLLPATVDRKRGLMRLQQCRRILEQPLPQCIDDGVDLLLRSMLQVGR